ncbi:hypothetical protein LZ30DRAFT_713719 [Colletotrichum cereale]|nr:hypothetical protein LZ30DRAFT_713719 [Colletotrichum cereale]
MGKAVRHAWMCLDLPYLLSAPAPAHIFAFYWTPRQAPVEIQFSFLQMTTSGGGGPARCPSPFRKIPSPCPGTVPRPPRLRALLTQSRYPSSLAVFDSPDTRIVVPIHEVVGSVRKQPSPPPSVSFPPVVRCRGPALAKRPSSACLGD